MRKFADSVALYIPSSPNDEKWGIVCTTIGFQDLSPNEEYPKKLNHGSYTFRASVGRILNEYQLIYIEEGEGYFESSSCKRTEIKAGTMIMLFPGEWHSYAPKKETGWKEWWVGFTGVNIDRRVEENFFSPKDPIFYIGYSPGIISCYQEIKSNCIIGARHSQILMSSIVLHILGSIIYKRSTYEDALDPNTEKIQQAAAIMKDSVELEVTPQQVADQLGIGYSWFRHKFKEHTGLSPAKYQLQLKHFRAKELLSDSALQIKDVAFRLGFDNLSQFSTFFKSYEGISPRVYKQQITLPKLH